MNGKQTHYFSESGLKFRLCEEVCDCHANEVAYGLEFVSKIV